MTVYKGKINCRKLADKLHEFFVAEGYSEISSNIPSDGRVYMTTGSDGKDKYYVRIFDPKSNYLSVGVYESYTPAQATGIAGTFSSVGYFKDPIDWNRSSSDTHEVEYIVNITIDRAIIYVSGKPQASNFTRSLTYVGMPKRYSKDDRGADACGISSTSGWPGARDGSAWHPLRNRAKNTQSHYLYICHVPNKAVGWNNQLFFSPMTITSSVEGPRGELDGLYLTKSFSEDNEILHGDTFTKNGKSYIALKISSNTRTAERTFNTSYDYVMEI